MLTRGAARMVGAQAGLVAVSEGMGDVDGGLATWSDAMDLESLPTSLTDQFLGRAFGCERAVREPSRDEPDAG